MLLAKIRFSPIALLPIRLVLIGLVALIGFITQDSYANSSSVLLQGLDRTTARTSEFEVRKGNSVFFGRLEIYMRHCKESDPTEVPDNTAFLEIFEYQLTRRSIIAQSLRQAELKDIANGISSQERLGRKLQREKIIIEEYGAEILQEEFTPNLIFSGWMVSSSPPLNPLEHPVYDVWVVSCVD